MKSFRKALAVMLAVLMVVFSFPFSAMALDNPYKDEGIYAEDYDVEFHAYVTNYDCQYGYAADSITEQWFDPTQPLKKADLSSEDGCFAIIVTVKNLDAAEVIQLLWDVDWTKVTPAEYGRKDALTTGDDAGDMALETWKDYNRAVDTTGTANKHVTGMMNVTAILNGQTPDAETTMECGSVVDGQLLAVLGFQMLADEINLQEVFDLHLSSDDSTVICQVGNDNMNIVAVGAHDAFGNPVKYTTYEFPEWGVVGSSDTTVDYTYTMADGSQQTVTVNEGKTPTAPANTEDTAFTSNEDGTHSKTTYSWPTFDAAVTEYTEVATTVTEDCKLVQNDDAVAPGHATDGTKASSTCSVCGYKKAGETDPATGHDWDWDAGVVTPATCVAKGYTTYTCTANDGGVLVADYTDIDSTNHAGNIVAAGNDKVATCTEKGYTGDQICDACNAVAVPGTEIPVDANNHTAVRTVEGKEPTRAEDGYTESTVCDDCGTTIKPAVVIPALGVMITVATNELGTATLNGDAATGEAQKVAYASNYTITAAANEGAEFVGWTVNGKMISTDAAYTTAAYADTTYVPVFTETENAFTVTFVDIFNNVIATLSADEVAALTELPTPFAVQGYTFAGYDMTLEEVQALDHAAVVTAQFEKNEEEAYTVTAPGCTIYVNGVQADSDTVMVPHDARVAVMPANDDVATSWTVNGNEAAYSEKYTFYVTSDVTVAYSTAEVNAAPTVIAINGNGERVEGTAKVRFLASRTVTGDYTLVESGFVYGKNLAAVDLTLENVGNGCYLYKNSNTAGDGQFALTFGVSAQTGTACARAYMIVKNNATGATEVKYAVAQIYAY